MASFLFEPWWLISLIFSRLILRRLLRIDWVVVMGHLVYGLILIMLNISRRGWKQVREALNFFKSPQGTGQPRMFISPKSVLDFNNAFRLAGLSVILDPNRRIRIDLDRYHTLIAGQTGGGKTNLLNVIIAQLVVRPDFAKNYELYIFDLKGSRHDHLSSWSKVGHYIGLDEDGTTTTAIKTMNEICDQMHQDDKHYVVVIDETSMLSVQAQSPELKRSGIAALRRLTAQLRDTGAIVAAAQYIHHDIIHRDIAGQFARKICLRVDDNEWGRMVFRFRPQVDMTGLKPGEFVMYEPGRPQRETLGRLPLLDTPREIELTLSRTMHFIEAGEDMRITILRQSIAQGPGRQLVGINRLKTEQIRSQDHEIMRRNWARAEAIEPIFDKNGNVAHYILEIEPQEAEKKVRAYIEAGKWQPDPEPIKVP